MSSHRGSKYASYQSRSVSDNRPYEYSDRYNQRPNGLPRTPVYIDLHSGRLNHITQGRPGKLLLELHTCCMLLAILVYAMDIFTAFCFMLLWNI